MGQKPILIDVFSSAQANSYCLAILPAFPRLRDIRVNIATSFRGQTTTIVALDIDRPGVRSSSALTWSDVTVYTAKDGPEAELTSVFSDHAISMIHSGAYGSRRCGPAAAAFNEERRPRSYVPVQRKLPSEHEDMHN